MAGSHRLSAGILWGTSRNGRHAPDVLTHVSEPISVHVWSDVACPWCFIGKRRFEKAVAAFDGEVTVEYHSFELSPDTPVDFDGSVIDFLARHKRMPEAQVVQMVDHVTSLAAAEGLAYDFQSVQHTKTLKAHELLHFAKSEGRQLDMAERLFSAYFEQGRHIGRIPELVGLASEAGLDGDDVHAALTSGRYGDAVAADIAQARAYGINGVPFYVIDNRFGVSGAQSPETFTGALTQAAEARDSVAPAEVTS